MSFHSFIDACRSSCLGGDPELRPGLEMVLDVSCARTRCDPSILYCYTYNDNIIEFSTKHPNINEDGIIRGLFFFFFLASIELLHRSFYGSSQKMLQDVIFVWGGAPLCSSWWVPVLPRNSQGFGSFLLCRTLWLFVLSPWYRVAAKICLMGFPHWCRPKTWRVRIEFNLVHDTRLVFGDKM